jgi:DNA-binding transcriptional LysR family regulator
MLEAVISIRTRRRPVLTAQGPVLLEHARTVAGHRVH